jgi:hypothetical protein
MEENEDFGLGSAQPPPWATGPNYRPGDRAQSWRTIRRPWPVRIAALLLRPFGVRGETERREQAVYECLAAKDRE